MEKLTNLEYVRYRLMMQNTHYQLRAEDAISAWMQVMCVQKKLDATDAIMRNKEMT